MVNLVVRVVTDDMPEERYSPTRRQMLLTAVGLASGALLSVHDAANAFNIGKPLQAGEDLMQEHGVLGRSILIYDALSARFEQGFVDPQDCLMEATELIIKYVQGQHERVEELLVFPALTKANALPELVSVLISQHKVGRELTNLIKSKVQRGSHRTSQGRIELAKLTKMFSVMFRPHMLREDTVIFPKLHEIMGEIKYQEFSSQLQSLESKMINNTDLGTIVRQLDDIEITLGIHELAQFTAQLPESKPI